MILFLLTSLIISNTGLKAGIPVLDINSNNSAKKIKVLNGTVSEIKDLPEEIYGEWRVASQTIETNNPQHWGEIGLDNWVFARSGNKVTLLNPKSGAESTITVNEVIGNKARFTRENLTENYVETENLEITINDIKFSGTDTQIIKHLYKNKIYKTDVVKYRVVGKKISGSALKNLFAK